MPISGYEGQDAEHGRDALAANGQLQKVGGKGFGFTKLDANGNPLRVSEPVVVCKDNHTGLIWEVKTDDGGLLQSDGYNWYNPQQHQHPGYQSDGDICYGYNAIMKPPTVTPMPLLNG